MQYLKQLMVTFFLFIATLAKADEGMWLPLLLEKLNEKEMISWKGQLTQTISNRGVYPRPYQEKLPVWIAVGGTPESVIRAAEYGLPMALAIIGGLPARFTSLTRLYRDVYKKAGRIQ